MKQRFASEHNNLFIAKLKNCRLLPCSHSSAWSWFSIVKSWLDVVSYIWFGLFLWYAKMMFVKSPKGGVSCDDAKVLPKKLPCMS
jgi:hypothetical protein